MPVVIVSGPFDDLRSRHVRLLQEASRRGPVRVGLWDDLLIERKTGRPPKFPLKEREYFLRALRFVEELVVCGATDEPAGLPRELLTEGGLWAYEAAEDTAARREFCRKHQMVPCPLTAGELAGFPEVPSGRRDPRRKKVIVTGCYDWLHSGHVRFFEEVSALGELYVAVGNDANVRHLKGPEHPMLKEEERRYMVAAIRFVTEALITSGWGWLDAEPEIRRLKPDLYAVNEDGDKPEKRAYCEANGIEYVVLKRTPAPGLPPRSSTALRGF